MGIPSVSDGIRGRLEEEHGRLDAAGDLLSREALDGNYKRFAESIDRADRAAEAVQDAHPKRLARLAGQRVVRCANDAANCSARVMPTLRRRRAARQGATRLRRLRPMSACQSCFGKSLGFLSFTASPVRTFLSPISSL